MKPLAIDLCCGDFGGWAEGFLAEGFDVIGFDIERHTWSCYPGQLILQDILTVSGMQLKPILDRLAVIVASPPCQKYSYMAMPWKKAKALATWYQESPERISELNALFDACFRIQREASEAAGRYIPLIVENVKGAQPWVGQARWHFGSYYLWGDVPALMPNGIGRKIHASCSLKRLRDAFGWTGSIMREGTSHGAKRKAASAMIAKIPFPLARHIATCFREARPR